MRLLQVNQDKFLNYHYLAIICSVKNMSVHTHTHTRTLSLSLSLSHEKAIPAQKYPEP